MPTHGDIKLAWEVAHAGFGHPDETVEKVRVERRRERIASGHLIVSLAFDQGVAASTGLIMIEGEVGELAAVATRPEHRRKGLASDASSILLTEFFARGGQVAWLSAADEAARGTYLKLGFKHVGKQVNYVIGSPLCTPTALF